MTREEIQEEAKQQILKYKKCALQISPRVGKTRLILETFKNTSDNILISVPEEGIFNSWWEECDKIEFNKERLTLICHASLSKIDRNKYKIIIIDEAHQSLTIKRLEALKRFKSAEYLVLMSGSFTQQHIETIKYNLNLNLVYDYSFEQAVKDGIISNYSIEIYRISLFPKEKIKYNQLTNYVEYCKNFGNSEKLKHAALARGRFLYNLESKNIIAKQFVDRTDRILVFNNLIAAAEAVCENTHSSKNMQGNLEKFKTCEINKLAVVSLGGMGITFPALNNVLFNSIQASQVKVIQRALRACNLEGDSDKIADIKIIINKDTIEEQWVEKALTQFNKEKINDRNI